MQLSLRTLFCLLPLVALTTVAPADEEKITFQDQIAPIFSSACTNCHNPDDQKGGLDLTTHSGTVGGGSGGSIVEAGDPGASRLIGILRGEEQPRMPPSGGGLSGADVAMLERWIASGLLKSKDSRPAAVNRGPALAFEAGTGKPDGPPPMPSFLSLEPALVAERPGTIRAIAASPWAPLLAVGGESQVLLFHLETLQPLGILPFPEGGPMALSFSANGRYLLAGGGLHAREGKVVVWDVTTGRRVMQLGQERDAVLAASLRPDLQEIALGGPLRLLRFYGPASEEPIDSIKKHSEWILATAYSPDGKWLASGDRNGGLQVWEANGHGELFSLESHKGGLTQLAWRPDGQVLASVGADGKVALWEMRDGKRIKQWDAHKEGVLAVDWSNEGPIVTGGRDGRVVVWKSDGGKLRELPKADDIITAVSISSDGKRVVAGDFKGGLRVFDLETGNLVRSLSVNPSPVSEQTAQTQQRLADLRQKLAESDSLEKKTADTLEAELEYASSLLRRLEAEPLIAEIRSKRELIWDEDAKVAEAERYRSEKQQALDTLTGERDALIAAIEKGEPVPAWELLLSQLFVEWGRGDLTNAIRSYEAATLHRAGLKSELSRLQQTLEDKLALTSS